MNTNGFLVVDKPGKLTSHDVVAKVRKGTGVKKIGHAGTLDPMATGVLVLCLGYATRLSEYVMASDKTYQTTLMLGIETDTYDADGRPTAEASEAAMSSVTQALLEAALVPFRGPILQVPPMYSAIQKNGKRLYELARSGIEIEREPRPVTIYDLKLLSWNLPYIVLEVTCSAGTYIRSIAHDLGTALGVGAHLTTLRRTRSGKLDDPIDWGTIQKAMNEETWDRLLIDEHVPLGHIPAVALDSIEAALFQRGQAVTVESLPPDLDSARPDGGELRVYDPADRMIGMGEMRAGKLYPGKVFGA